jgi:hypothetical protein
MLHEAITTILLLVIIILVIVFYAILAKKIDSQIYQCPVTGSRFGPQQAIKAIVNHKAVLVCSKDCKKKIENY